MGRCRGCEALADQEIVWAIANLSDRIIDALPTLDENVAAAGPSRLPVLLCHSLILGPGMSIKTRSVSEEYSVFKALPSLTRRVMITASNPNS